VLLQSQFHARETAALLGEVDGASLVPTMLHRLVAERADLPWPKRLKSLLVGGGPLSDELAARSAALGVEPLQTYGLTESGSQACTPTAPARAERGRCGTPLASLELEVRRADGTRAGADEEGQIHLRGPQLFAGYEERGALAAPHQPGAWFATGDLGDIDAAGRLRVHCRRDDLILSGGENIYPAMVEAALESHADVAEAGVCPLPDPAWGQVVGAVVVPKPGADLDAEALSAWVAARLSPIQRPRRWAFRATLPRTESGKLARRQLPTCFSD
jgi:O-succinylbenzoic acid--CoA ligase